VPDESGDYKILFEKTLSTERRQDGKVSFSTVCD